MPQNLNIVPYDTNSSVLDTAQYLFETGTISQDALLKLIELYYSTNTLTLHTPKLD